VFHRSGNNRPQEEESMSSIVKITEVIAQSENGFEDAVRNAVKEAAKTVRGIKSVWIDNFKCKVEGDKIVEYRVNAKISFLVEGHK
jgi:flavin-binding protein dodecin